MSAPFLVTYSALMGASATWDNQAEALRGSHKRLTDAKNSVAGLGDRVSPVASTYLETWLEQVTTLAEAAQSRSEGLTEFMRSTIYFDQSAADEIRAALPWSDRSLSGPLQFGNPGSTLMPPSPSPGPSPSPISGPR